MKPKTTLTKEQMKSFSIDDTTHFEGCAQATMFLKRIYGDERDDLRKRKKDFTTLIRMSKGHWVISFLLNTITKTYRAKYISGVLSQHLDLAPEDTKLLLADTLQNIQTYAKKPTKKLLTTLTGNHIEILEHRTNIKKTISAIGAQAVKVSQDKFEELMTHSQYLKAFLILIEDIEGNLTKSSLKAVQQTAEAKQWLNMRKDEGDYNKDVLIQCATHLTDYVGYFL